MLLSVALVSCGTSGGGTETFVSETETDVLSNKTDVSGNQTEDKVRTFPDSERLPVKFYWWELGDRMATTIEWFEQNEESYKTSERSCAVCLVTMVDVDLSKVDEESAKKVPFTLKIEEIFSSSPSFDFREGDSIVANGRSLWKKRDYGYLVWVQTCSFPIVEYNAQYIVFLRENYSDEYDETGVLHGVWSFTVPISTSYTTVDTLAELYAEMKAPFDMSRLSYDLILREFGESALPPYDEIDTKVKELRKAEKNNS